ncbi:unnamed protein product [Mycena citricolor]|uniref:Transcription factor 25 n=1 Tax=Mycena citricolor TaxID=2018698 RepID=A0AAD2HSH9_9AGAR|nr:unnamed protein product [Mycena citricolor]
MPPRLNKRQQRELEELESLARDKTPLNESDDDEEDDGADDGADQVVRRGGASGAGGGFSALFVPDEDEESADEDRKPKSKKKKKKKPSSAAAPAPAPVATPRPHGRHHLRPAPKNEKKAAKKAKARERKAGKDEIDQALAELSIKYPELQTVASMSKEEVSSSEALASLLSVSLQHLDSEGEMRKFFGAKVVQANKSGDKASGAGSSRRQTGHRSNLTRRNPGEDGQVRAGSLPNEKWWTVEYTRKYKSITLAFINIVYSGDPNGFYDLVRQFPWHGDTLLQLAEVFRHREEYAQAVEYVDRALFAYERAFFGCSFNFTAGIHRLDFDHVENRPFFLALHRQTTDLQRRGCVRTAFEFARLLLSLDPTNDPHGALLHLDFLAIKTGMGQWLLDMFELYATRRKQVQTQDARVDPSLLPGWSYARALAIRTAGKAKDSSAGTAELREAVHNFPSIVPLLADKLDVSLPNTVRSHPDCKIETDGRNLHVTDAVLHLLSHLYAQRSFPLWKDESAWFSSTVADEFSSPSGSSTTRRQDFLALYQNVNLRYSVYRHVMVLETSYRRLFSYIPSDVLNTKTLQCDPLPPPTAVTSYDDAYFVDTDDLRSFMPRLSSRQRAQQGRILAQMIPDGALRDQLQGFFNAMPAVQERFPGGVLQFAEAAAQMAPDEFEALMMAAMAANEDAQMPGDMPGDMPGVWQEDGVPAHPNAEEQIEEGDDDEDEDDEDEEVAPLPLRVIRNVFGRFWGGNAPADDSSSDDDPVDDTGVD